MPQALDQANVICTALIALGSNQSHDVQGRPDQTVRNAMAAVSDALGPIAGKSRLFETPCFPAGAGSDYVNAAVRLDTALAAAELIATLHRIEAEFGRLRQQRWGQRTLDLDLLALGDAILPDRATQARWRSLPPEAQIGQTPDQLILPHPRLQDRAFVLVPLADIAPDWVHPVLGQSVVQMLAALPRTDLADIRPLPEPTVKRA